MAHAAARHTSGMPWKRWTAAGKRKTQKLRPSQKKTSTHAPKPCHGQPQSVRLAARAQEAARKRLKGTDQSSASARRDADADGRYHPGRLLVPCAVNHGH
jgi:hypothetical protein